MIVLDVDVRIIRSSRCKSVEIDIRVTRLILSDEIPRAEDAGRHIIDPGHWDTAIPNGLNEIGAKVRRTRVENDVARHCHIEASEDSGDSRVLEMVRRVSKRNQTAAPPPTVACQSLIIYP